MPESEKVTLGDNTDKLGDASALSVSETTTEATPAGQPAESAAHVEPTMEMKPVPDSGLRWYRVWTRAITKPSVTTFEEIVADPKASGGKAALWIAIPFLIEVALFAIISTLAPQSFGQNLAMGELGLLRNAVLAPLTAAILLIPLHLAARALKHRNRSPVIPAKAGIHVARTDYRLIREQRVASVDVKRKLRWIPAFAGMTGERLLVKH